MREPIFLRDRGLRLVGDPKPLDPIGLGEVRSIKLFTCQHYQL
jgi:hypothetical protein